MNSSAKKLFCISYRLGRPGMLLPCLFVLSLLLLVTLLLVVKVVLVVVVVVVVLVVYYLRKSLSQNIQFKICHINQLKQANFYFIFI